MIRLFIKFVGINYICDPNGDRVSKNKKVVFIKIWQIWDFVYLLIAPLNTMFSKLNQGKLF